MRAPLKLEMDNRHLHTTRGVVCANGAMLVTTLSCVAFAASRLSDRVYNPRLPTTTEAQRTRVVRIPRFASDEDIDAVHAAAAAIRDAGAKEVVRSNGLKSGSWRTIFFNHQLALQLPQLHTRLLAAAHEADAANWGLLDSGRHGVALRCAEYHSVREAGGLPMANHNDYGSLITMDLMLSPSGDYSGGDFCTKEVDGEMLSHRFERGDLLLFVSHKYHSVRPVTNGRRHGSERRSSLCARRSAPNATRPNLVVSGTRQVLVCELWEGLERRCPCRCPQPWGACSCSLSGADIHINCDEAARTDLASVPFSRATPLPLKHAWSAARRVQLAANRRRGEPLMTERAGKPAEEGDVQDKGGPQQGVVSLLDALADASWDMFVMPGEAANSRYDRPLEPMDEAKDETKTKRPTFDWGGDESDKALRLPTGVRSAERLAARVPVERPRGRWFEREGRDIAGDIELLSREWTRLWAVIVAVTVLVLAADNLDLP